MKPGPVIGKSMARADRLLRGLGADHYETVPSPSTVDGVAAVVERLVFKRQCRLADFGRETFELGPLRFVGFS